jgi:hypothetical protein
VQGGSIIAVASSAEDGYLVRESDRDHAVATASNMVFAMWRRKTTPDACRHVIDVAGERARAYPEGIGLTQIIDVEAEPPSAEARRIIVEMMKLPGMNYFAAVHDEGGFKAAALRAVTLGVYALARPTCKVMVHPTFAATAKWQEARQREMGRRESAAHIEGILHGVREFHRNRYP